MKKTCLMMSILLASLTAFAQEPDVESAAENVLKTNPAMERIVELLQTGTDPFSFGYNRDADAMGQQNLIPVDASQLASLSIQVKGILVIEGEPPCGLVQVGKDARMQLVRENDLILLPRSTARKDGQKPLDSSRYLLVTKILKDSMMVAPKRSPENIITIR